MMRVNPSDPAATFDEPTKPPPSAQAIKLGRQQVRQMLDDRPAMAKYGKKAEALYEWAARKFAGEDLHQQILWNSSDPPPDFPCDHQPPSQHRQGFIRLWRVYPQGPAKGQERRFEELWSDAVFELYNIAGVRDFDRIEANAVAGRLSRREFCVKMLETESLAAEKSRTFYIRVFLPWAKEHGVPTQPGSWYVACRSDPKENLYLRAVGSDDPHWRYYGTCYDQIALRVLAAKGKDDEARKLAAEMVKRATTKQAAAEIYCAKGSIYAAKGDFDKAVADYSEAIKVDPKCVLACQCRGFIYSEKGELDRALVDLTEAIRLKPDDGTSHYYRARTHFAKGDLDAAVSDVLDAIRITPGLEKSIKPQWVQICLQSAGHYAGNGDWDKALAACRQALRLDPANAVAYHGRGYVYVQKRDYAKALPDLNEAIRLDPKAACVYANRAGVYFEMGDLDHAIADYVEALRIQPQLADRIEPFLAHIYVQRADGRTRKHNWDGAIADLTEARRLTPAPCRSTCPTPPRWLPPRRCRRQSPRPRAVCRNATLDMRRHRWPPWRSRRRQGSRTLAHHRSTLEVPAACPRSRRNCRAWTRWGSIVRRWVINITLASGRACRGRKRPTRLHPG